MEVPKAIQRIQYRNSRSLEDRNNDQLYKSRQKQKERIYEYVNYFGVLVNVVFVVWYSIEYGKQLMHTEQTQDILSISYLSMNGVALVSCFFLADALRRIYNSYKEQTSLMSNEKIMGLHLVLLIIYFLSILFKSYTI